MDEADVGGIEWSRAVAKASTHLWLKDSETKRPRLLVLYEPGEKYDLRNEYEKSRRKNATSTPHGSFWMLGSEDLLGALTFLNEYGPLDNDDGPWIDIQDFYRKQLRFKLVTKLWLTLRDESALRQTWEEIAKNIQKLNRADTFPVADGLRNTTYPTLRRPWTEDPEAFEEWIEEAKYNTLFSKAVTFVRMEMNKHAEDTPLIYETAEDDTGRREEFKDVAFKLNVGTKDLWSSLWFQFGLDTTRRPELRLCLDRGHSEKLFYAARGDRYYCTTEEQQRASKRAWWHRKKGPELIKRRKARSLAK
ncbi:MAG: hypothetical protein M3O09_10880 [Acidobacteriota bacterium]|nr:hypothetical protein [Acidobacteriota bacterium]